MEMNLLGNHPLKVEANRFLGYEEPFFYSFKWQVFFGFSKWKKFNEGKGQCGKVTQGGTSGGTCVT